MTGLKTILLTVAILVFNYFMFEIYLEGYLKKLFFFDYVLVDLFFICFVFLVLRLNFENVFMSWKKFFNLAFFIAFASVLAFFSDFVVKGSGLDFFLQTLVFLIICFCVIFLVLARGEVKVSIKNTIYFVLCFLLCFWRFVFFWFLPTAFLYSIYMNYTIPYMRIYYESTNAVEPGWVIGLNYLIEYMHNANWHLSLVFLIFFSIVGICFFAKTAERYSDFLTDHVR